MEIDFWERVLTAPLPPPPSLQPTLPTSSATLAECSDYVSDTTINDLPPHTHPLPLPRPAILIDTSNSRRSWLCPVYPSLMSVLDDVSVL